MPQPKPIANAYVVYSRLFKYVRRYWVALVIAMFASILYSGVDAWFVYFLKPLLSRQPATPIQQHSPKGVVLLDNEKRLAEKDNPWLKK